MVWEAWPFHVVSTMDAKSEICRKVHVVGQARTTPHGMGCRKEGGGQEYAELLDQFQLTS